MDKMRKDFERWFRIQGHIMERHPEYVECYFNPIVQSHWAAWQASRAALCVELPDFSMCEDGEGWWAGYTCAISDVKSGLNQIGVTCK